MARSGDDIAVGGAAGYASALGGKVIRIACGTFGSGLLELLVAGGETVNYLCSYCWCPAFGSRAAIAFCQA